MVRALSFSFPHIPNMKAPQRFAIVKTACQISASETRIVTNIYAGFLLIAEFRRRLAVWPKPASNPAPATNLSPPQGVLVTK